METDAESASCDRLKEYLATRRRHCDVDVDLSSAWEEFYASHAVLVRKSVGSQRHAQFGVDDLCQDAWLAIVSHLHDLEFDPSRGHLESWIVVVTRHIVARRAKRLPRTAVGPINPEIEAVLVSREGDPSDACEARDRREQVRLALDRLRASVPGEGGRVIHEHWFEERPLSEVASRLGLTLAQVRGIYRKAMRTLRSLLASPCEEANEDGPSCTLRENFEKMPDSVSPFDSAVTTYL